MRIYLHWAHESLIESFQWQIEFGPRIRRKSEHEHCRERQREEKKIWSVCRHGLQVHAKFNELYVIFPFDTHNHTHTHIRSQVPTTAMNKSKERKEEEEDGGEGEDDVDEEEMDGFVSYNTHAFEKINRVASSFHAHIKYVFHIFILFLFHLRLKYTRFHSPFCLYLRTNSFSYTIYIFLFRFFPSLLLLLRRRRRCFFFHCTMYASHNVRIFSPSI